MKLLTLNDLIEDLLEQAEMGHGDHHVFDTDGHPIIGISLDDSESETHPKHPRLYIEAEF